jgi:hypothetical protein
MGTGAFCATCITRACRLPRPNEPRECHFGEREFGFGPDHISERPLAADFCGLTTSIHSPSWEMASCSQSSFATCCISLGTTSEKELSELCVRRTAYVPLELPPVSSWKSYHNAPFGNLAEPFPFAASAKPYERCGDCPTLKPPKESCMGQAVVADGPMAKRGERVRRGQGCGDASGHSFADCILRLIGCRKMGTSRRA